MSEGFGSDAEIVRILHGYNVWWDGRRFSPPDFRRLAFRTCIGHLTDANLKRGVLLCGPRRVGKTTILNQIAKQFLAEGREPRSIVYLSLDHPLLKLRTLPEVLRLYHEYVYPEGKPATLLLDEIQYSRDWELQLKQLIDHKPEYRILATGSATLDVQHRSAESGVGRWIHVSIPTLSFYEFLSIRETRLPNLPADLRPTDLFAKSDRELMALGLRFQTLMLPFARYLLVGGFPETARLEDVTLCQQLLREDVVERVLKRDMAALFQIRKVEELEKLFIYLCLHSGDIFEVSTISRTLQVSAITVANHLTALQRANLIYRLPSSRTGGKSVLKAREKIYIVDAALCNAVLLRGEEILTDPNEKGRIIETTVLRHLFAYHYPETPRIVYWRDSATDKEVDIIVQVPRHTIPVEVKYREDASLGEKEGIVEYCRQESVRQAYWVTQRDHDFGVVQFPGLDTKFLKIPAHIFTYLLGQAERLLWVR